MFSLIYLEPNVQFGQNLLARKFYLGKAFLLKISSLSFNNIYKGINSTYETLLAFITISMAHVRTKYILWSHQFIGSLQLGHIIMSRTHDQIRSSQLGHIIM